LINKPRQGSNNYTADASKIRDNFREYFNSETVAVSWPEAHNLRGFELLMFSKVSYLFKVTL